MCYLFSILLFLLSSNIFSAELSNDSQEIFPIEILQLIFKDCQFDVLVPARAASKELYEYISKDNLFWHSAVKERFPDSYEQEWFKKYIIEKIPKCFQASQRHEF